MFVYKKIIYLFIYISSQIQFLWMEAEGKWDYFVCVCLVFFRSFLFKQKKKQTKKKTNNPIHP